MSSDKYYDETYSNRAQFEEQSNVDVDNVPHHNGVPVRIVKTISTTCCIEKNGELALCNALDIDYLSDNDMRKLSIEESLKELWFDTGGFNSDHYNNFLAWFFEHKESIVEILKD